MTTLAEINLADCDAYIDDVPHHWFETLRREAPVFWNAGDEDDGPGFWAVTKHEDLKFVSRTPQIFSSFARGTNLREPLPEELEWLQHILINMDPPEHRSFRSLVKAAFTPRAVKRLHSAVEEMATKIVDDVVEKGECEFVDEVAAQMPMEVICEMVGVPEEFRRPIYDATNKLIGFDDPELRPVDSDPMEAVLEMMQYSAATAEHVKAHPGDNLATTLLNSEIDGEPVSVIDFNTFFLMLAVAGNETTRTVTTHGFRLLIEYPEVRERILADPTLLDAGIREMLRYSPAVHHFRRQALEDVVIGEQQIRANDKVTVWYTSANRDEAVYENPNVFDIDRNNSDHLAFGVGEHFCLGAHLAMLELRAILGQCIRRMPNPELAGPVRRLRSNFINGVKEMPVRFDT